jgi:Peptidase inhibitor family I36
MRLKNLTQKLLPVAVVAAGLSALAVQPAFAASAAYTCQSNQVCFYKNANFSGTVFVPAEMNNRDGGVSNFITKAFTDGTNVNDRVSSVVNNAGWCVGVYVDTDFGPTGIIISPHSRVNLLDHLNDAISSAQYEHGFGGCP